MYKKALITVIAAVLLVSAVLVCAIPRFHKIDVSLNIAKINDKGETLGTYETVLRGNRLEYLLTDERLDISISPFDGLSGFKVHGNIEIVPGTDICYTLCSASNAATNEVAFFDIAFNPAMDRWLFMNTTDQIFYVASVDGAYSAHELIDYFRPMIPSSWIVQ